MPIAVADDIVPRSANEANWRRGLSAGSLWSVNISKRSQIILTHILLRQGILLMQEQTK